MDLLLQIPDVDTVSVRTRIVLMKNITLSAEEELIANARAIARQRATSLNELFRSWLRDLARPSGSAQSYDRLMERLELRASGRRFNREEMNER